MANIDEFLPLTGKEPPPGWRRRVDGLSAFYHGVWDNEKKQMRVIISYSNGYGDGKWWYHVSVSHRKRIITYDELTYVKRHWVGDDHKAIMVLPEKSKHVNIHPNCLHLFCCLDGDPLPDFTGGMDTI
jgi:hypothetical protein